MNECTKVVEDISLYSAMSSSMSSLLCFLAEPKSLPGEDHPDPDEAPGDFRVDFRIDYPELRTYFPGSWEIQSPDETSPGKFQENF